MKQQTLAPPCYGARSSVGDPQNWHDPMYDPKHIDETALLVPRPAWADPTDVSNEELETRKTHVNMKLKPLRDSGYLCTFNDRVGLSKRYLNPKGKTGITGRGILGKFGPNHAADVLVTRRNTQTGVYEALLVEKNIEGESCLAWPAGMVEAGESVPETLKRELLEEAVAQNEAVDLLFSICKRGVVFAGHVDDWRNTDHAWMETNAVHFHATDMIGAQLKLSVQDVGEINRSRWVDIDRVRSMYASHMDWLRILRGICTGIEKTRIARPTTSLFISYATFVPPNKRNRDDESNEGSVYSILRSNIPRQRVE